MRQEKDHPWAGSTDWESLVAPLFNATPLPKQRADARVRVLFHSPTTFKAAARSLPLPLPPQLFGSLASRWNNFSPVPLDEAFASFVEAEVSISAFQLQSELALLEGGRKGPKLVCFRGWCEYTSFARDSEWSLALQMLGKFGFYSGVGYKATMGFGQLRCV